MLTVVTGPPCSGKSTWARERHRPGDILIDYDAIAQALGSPKPHDHPDPVRWTAIAARRAAVNAAIQQHHHGATVWIVHTRIPNADMARYLAAGAEIVTLTVDRETLHERAARERPQRWHELIDEWTPEAPQRKPAQPRQSSYDRLTKAQRRGRGGRPWRRMRAAVLATSTICWICHHDGADSVDHIVPLAHGGAPLSRDNLAPAHNNPCPTCRRRCNPSRGAARGDHAYDSEPTRRGTPARRPTIDTTYQPQIIKDLRW